MYTRAWDAITVRAQASHRPRGRCVARCAEGAFSAVVGPVRSDFDFPFIGKTSMAHVSKKLSVINHWDLRDAAGNTF